MSISSKVGSLAGVRLPVLPASIEERARGHAVALVAVALVFVARRLLVADGAATAYLLFDAVVAGVALWGGLEPALTAAAASTLLGLRVLSDHEISTLSAVLLFALQAVAVAAIVSRVRDERQQARRAFELEQQEHEADREAMRALERQHAADTRDMSERYDRLKSESKAEQEATLGRLDATAGQLQRLETLTDPALSDLPTAQLLDELLGRIQATLGADAAILVDARNPNLPAVFGPAAPNLALRRDFLRRRATDGERSTRIHLVQNDPERLAETSVIAWRNPVATLVSVPVVCAGATLGVIEIAIERARRWTDWDTALLRVVADRAAWVLLTAVEVPASIARRA